MAAICAAAPLALANQLPLPTIVACRGIAAVSSAIEESDLLTFTFLPSSCPEQPGQGRLPTLRTRRCLGHSTGSSDAAGNVQDGTG